MEVLQAPHEGDERTAILHQPDVRRLISWTVQGHEKIMPLPTREGDCFPEVSRLIGDREKVVLLLEELTYHGIYRRIKAYSEPACPNCRSSEISDKYVCPFCEGKDLEKGQRIQHLGCGHLDLETRFQEHDRFVCPKCGKEPRLIGTDYQRIENVFHCNDCDRDLSVPKIVQTCASCGNSFNQEEADLKPVFGYIFNEEERGQILADCLTDLPTNRPLETQEYDTEKKMLNHLLPWTQTPEENAHCQQGETGRNRPVPEKLERTEKIAALLHTIAFLIEEKETPEREQENAEMEFASGGVAEEDALCRMGNVHSRIKEILGYGR